MVSFFFQSRDTKPRFTREATTERIISSEHIQITIINVYTFFNLTDLTTILSIFESRGIIIDVSAVTTIMEISAEGYAFSVDVFTIAKSNEPAGQIQALK